MVEKSCPRCDGAGKINDGGSIAFPILKTCPTCSGTGEIRSGPMGDLERYGKEQTKRELIKELMNQRETLSCAYGGGDVLNSFWNLEESEADIIKVAFCLKARQIKNSWFGQIPNRENELSRMGCPEPRHRIFGGWRCKYADGKIHPI